MDGRRLLALSVLAFVFGCQDQQLPTGPKAPGSLSKIISDGANGGNRDFFFLPPLVPMPSAADGFEPGEFNNALRPSLTVEICRLKPDKLDKQHLPTPATPCYTNGPRDRFAAGSVQLVSNPLTETGWWTGLNLPADGFYYVQWDTREAHLNAQKFYRITVFIDGLTAPLGVVDIDPMKRLREFRPSRVGKVVQVSDNVLLPIPFRVENGVLCGGASECTSATVTNNNPNGETQVVAVEGGAGVIAGASFPDGWLPEGGPQSVVVTIAEVASEEDPVSRTRTTPCHVGLPFQQFNQCFNFTTTPALAPISPGVQFAEDVTVAVCYVLEGTEDPRRESAQLYASGPGEPPRALPEVSDEGILGPGARNCTTSEQEPIGLESSNPLTRLASAGWRTFKGGLSQLFGVKTAYAVDGGLGGIVKRFSNIGAALTAEIEAYPHAVPEPATTELTLESGTATARVRIVGSHSHAPGEGQGALDGINEIPVTFTVVPGSGTVSDGEGTGPQITVTTSTFNDEVLVSGIASVIWTPPSIAGVYTLKVTGPTADTVTFTTTVVEAGASIAVGNRFACAVLVGGVGSCWGANNVGQLGNGSEQSFVASPVSVAGGHSFIEISATEGSACGITVQHVAYCWGLNNNGQLGDGTRVNRNVPVAVAGNHSFRSIAAGSNISCALTDANRAFCWGRLTPASGGSLGDGVTIESNVPIEVASEQPLKSIAVGLLHACALDMGGHAYCWGSNTLRGLGTGDIGSRLVPAAVAGGHIFTSLTAGNAKGCGIENGAAWCWGRAFVGELGTGSTDFVDVLAPTQVVGSTVFRSVTPGGGNDVRSASCGIATNGLASCWGANSRGQLGGPSPETTCSVAGLTFGCTGTPLPVQGGHVFRELAVGPQVACGITVARQILCWGANEVGQLGRGTTSTSSSQPSLVLTGSLAQ